MNRLPSIAVLNGLIDRLRDPEAATPSASDREWSAKLAEQALVRRWRYVITEMPSKVFDGELMVIARLDESGEAKIDRAVFHTDHAYQWTDPSGTFACKRVYAWHPLSHIVPPAPSCPKCQSTQHRLAAISPGAYRELWECRACNSQEPPTRWLTAARGQR